jgi:transposase
VTGGRADCSASRFLETILLLRRGCSVNFINSTTRILIGGLNQIARGGSQRATVATAHAIAKVVYRMLKYKVEYETISVEEYEKKYKDQQLKYMKKRAAKLGYQLIPA